MSRKFKKRFLIPCESHSSSEEKDDGLFTATEMIKAEHKKLENRLSDQDLLDIKRKTMAEQDVQQWKSKQQRDKEAMDTSEPLTKSIMSMRAMPMSKLISQKSSKKSLEDSMPDLINFGADEGANMEVKEVFVAEIEGPEIEKEDLSAKAKGQEDSTIFQEGQLGLDKKVEAMEDKDSVREEVVVAELKDPKQMELKALKLFKQLSVELQIDETDEDDNTPVMSPIIKGFIQCTLKKLCSSQCCPCIQMFQNSFQMLVLTLNLSFFRRSCAKARPCHGSIRISH